MKILTVFFLLCLFPLYSQERVLVGIAGGTGSGKTTLSEKLIETFGDRVVLISQDSYYRDLSHLTVFDRGKVNFDHPDAIDFSLFKDHLIELKEGRGVNIPIYDFHTHTRVNRTVRIEPASVILVEGILLFAVPNLRQLLDIKVYVETDDDIRLLRRIQRDIKERGRSLDNVIEQYQTTVKPMHKQFVEPSKAEADLIIYGINENLSLISNLIYGYLKKGRAGGSMKMASSSKSDQ